LATSPRSKNNPSRPDDHVSNEAVPVSPNLGASGWARWIWRQLTSMQTALVLLLLLALAAIPGSIVPQRSADPNGVTTYFSQNPQLAPVLDKFQLFDVYTSAWFSAIYILLFVSLIGCLVPRIGVHYRAMRAKPVATPRALSRMPAFLAVKLGVKAKAGMLERAAANLRRQRYRVEVNANSVSAERGYLRETGNLVFHLSLVGLLIAVGVGGANSYSGQRVLVEGDTFVNNLASYDSFAPGTFFDPTKLTPFVLRLDKFDVQYDLRNPTNLGTPLDFRATVTTRTNILAKPLTTVIRVNEPLELPGAKVYLTGNGYAPVVTIRDANGDISFSGPTVYLPQDNNMTSLGVIKVPDAKPKQFGILSFFYPTAKQLTTKAYTSIYPQAIDPLLTMNVYVGNLGLDSGIPSNVFSLAVHGLKQVAGGKSGNKGLELRIGDTAKMPNNLGTVTFDGLKRYASLDVDYNPGQVWVLFFALLALSGLIVSLTIPRRRVWVKTTATGIEVAALARGDDPNLNRIIEELAEELKTGK
jgi:cytochrome c biogenesis protein